MDLDSAKSKAARTTEWTASKWNSPALRTALAAVPVIMVNATAFIGQFAFLNQHVPWPIVGRVMVAITVESIAVYIAFHAHLAQMKNDSATRLKLGSYLVALVIGVMNYSHYAGPHWHPAFMAVLMFMMSTLSPWLWGIHSRRASRDELLRRGPIEEHAVRLGANRWTWHPLRSSRVMYWATWHGVNVPDQALSHFEPRYGTPSDPCPPRKNRQAVPDQVVRQVAVPVPPTKPAPVPTQPVPPSLQPQAVPPVTGRTGDQVLDGTILNGRPLVRGDVHLAAEPVAAGPLTPQMIQNAELYLAGLPLDQLPGERTLASVWLGSEGRRRKARELLNARDPEGVRLRNRVTPDAAASNGHSRSPLMIATPLSQLPGGVNG